MQVALDIIQSKGNDLVFAQIESAADRTRRGIRQAFFRTGRDLVTDLKQEVLKKNKTGKIYNVRRGGRTRRHRSSAPGQSPASISGTYRRNVGFQLRGSSQLEFGVRNGAPYAKFLENGTKNMQARPGLGNTVKSVERNTRTNFESALETELNRP